MNRSGFIAALPFLVLAITAVAVMLLIAIRRDHRLTAAATVFGLVLSIVAIAPSAMNVPRDVTPLFMIDGFVLWYLGLVLATSLAVVLLSYEYLDGLHDGPYEEFYLLLLLATVGAAALVASVHFASFFLGLETLSIALIGLIAYPRGRERAVEAGIKYLMLAGISSAFLLFGIALIYLDLGTLSFVRLGQLARLQGSIKDVYTLAGFAMVLTGIGFKLSLVPFHMWAPDIYEGAPAPVTAYVAVVSKISVFALLLRYFVLTNGYGSRSLLVMFSFIAILSMLAGNFLALLQNNIKRILAYSSIAHLGYVLVAFIAGGALAIQAASYYLTAYAIMTLGAFGVVTLYSSTAVGRDADMLENYRGMFWSRPWLAGAFTVTLLSLAGIPPTMGFIAKIYVVTPGVDMSLLGPVTALVIGSVLGLYYYLRIIAVIFSPVSELVPASALIAGKLPRLPLPRAGQAVMVVVVILLIWLGVYPTPLVAFIQKTTAHLIL